MKISNQKSKIKNRKFLPLATALALTLTSTSFAESLWVKSANADIREGKGAVYPSLGAIPKGTEVTVVSRDGKWVQVTSAGKTGWVSDSALSTAKVNGDANLGLGANAEMSTGIAARGLVPGAETYAQSRGMSKAPLESLIAIRKNISPQEWTTFNGAVKRNP